MTTALPEAGSAADSLLEELIKIHSYSPTFRHAFQSQVTTQTFIDAFKAFVLAVSMTYELHVVVVRVLEKLSHFGLCISLDNAVAVAQSEEVIRPQTLLSSRSHCSPFRYWKFSRQPSPS